MVRLPKPKAPPSVVEFGSFALDLTTGDLRDNGRAVKLHPQPAQIFKMPAEGGPARQITRSGGFDSQESSDGRFLYYLRRHPDASYKWGDIYRVPVDGGEEIPVLEGKLLEQWNWTLWNDKIIYRHWTKKDGVQSGPCLISQKDLRSGEDTELSQLGGGLFCFGLTVSPDGDSLLFSRLGKPNADLILVENFRQ